MFVRSFCIKFVLHNAQYNRTGLDLIIA